MTQPNWTPQQHQAITAQGHNLLVSAAAGSGKTAVLAHRCAYLVCDAPQPCNIDQLLVVTFTNAAADEMRKRIGQVIAERAAQSDDMRLQRQALLINAAQISTIHALGSAILRRHFDAAGLDPNFRLLDEDEARLLRAEIAAEIPELRLSEEEADTFRELIEQYGGGRPTSISELILALHAKLSSLIDPDAWLAERRARVVEAAEQPLSQSHLGRELIEMTRRRFQTLQRSAERMAEMYTANPAVAGYGAYLLQIASDLREWNNCLTDQPFDAAAAVLRDPKFPRLPKTPASDEKDAAVRQITKLRDRIKKTVHDGMFAFNEAQLRDGMARTIWVIDQITSLLADFERRYTAAKRESGALDFNDLERITLRLLRDPDTGGPSRIAAEYQEQFCHVLVDEYQDVNEVQDTIISLLSRPDNLFVVGDVKQSIYRFRQADVRRFIARYKQYKPGPGKTGPEGEVIDLQQNFRSRGPLLQVLNGVFEALMTRESAEVAYVASQRLVPGAKYPDGQGLFTGRPVELHVVEERPTGEHELEADQREAVIAAARIRKILGYDGAPPATIVERDGTQRPAEPRDIVVLLRAMRVKAERFAEILRRGSVPVKADSTTGFFKATEIGDLIGTLRLIDNRRDDISLATYLRSPLAGVPDAVTAMATARLAHPPSGRTPCFFHSVERFIAALSTPHAAALKTAIDRLDHWRDAARTRSVADLLAMMFQETSLLAYVSGLTDGSQRVANVLHLHERARQFEAFNRPTVARFLEFLTSLENESDIGMPAVAGVAANAVRIMSIHKSKGLEFPIVILPDLGKAHNLRDVHEKLLVDDAVGIAARVVDTDKEVHYASLGVVLAQDQLRRKALAEELRVLYVAMTRAKEHLILIGTATEKIIEQWDAEWAFHRGPIDSGDVLGGSSMLDWIGPASSMVESASPGSFTRREHSAADVEAEAAALLGPRGLSPAAGRFASLRPLDPPPARDAQAEAAIARLSFKYAFVEMTSIPAVASVTSQTKRGKAVRVSDAAALPMERRFERALHLPRCMEAEARGRPEDIGTATHALLQHVDFAKGTSVAALRHQAEALAGRRFIRPALLNAIDYEGVAWFFSTDLGQSLAEASPGLLLREVDVVYAEPSTVTDDPRDRVMLRGRIDTVLITAEGLHIIDYKTDRVSTDSIDERATFYAPQLAAYGHAMAQLSRRPVIARTLAFITPRVLRTSLDIN